MAQMLTTVCAAPGVQTVKEQHWGPGYEFQQCTRWEPTCGECRTGHSSLGPKTEANNASSPAKAAPYSCASN